MNTQLASQHCVPNTERKRLTDTSSDLSEHMMLSRNAKELIAFAVALTAEKLSVSVKGGFTCYPKKTVVSCEVCTMELHIYKERLQWLELQHLPAGSCKLT